MSKDAVPIDQILCLDLSRLARQDKEDLVAYIHAKAMRLQPGPVEGTYTIQGNSNLSKPSGIQEQGSPDWNQDESSSKREDEKVSSSPPDSKKEEELSEYDRINKPFLAKTKPIAENVDRYKTFLSQVKIPRGARAKRMSRHALILLIEQIYTEKFAADASFFKTSLKEGKKEKSDTARPPLPAFTYDFLKAKIKSAKQLTQAAIDLVSSIEYHRKQCLEADLFCKFMEETFDNKDLIFLLYIRSIIEKELDIRFTDLKEQSLKKRFANVLHAAKEKKSIGNHEVDTRNVFMNGKECAKVMSIFFEEASESHQRLEQQFEENVVSSDGEKYISSTVFLLLMLMEFKRSRISSSPKKESSVQTSVKKAGIDDEELKAALFASLEPELEKMLTELIAAADNIEEETEGVIKAELKKVFGKHIEEIVGDLFKGNMENVRKALDISEERSEEDLTGVNDILRALRAYQQRRKEDMNPEDLTAISAAILQIPQLMTQIKMLVETFLSQLRAAAEGKQAEAEASQ